MRYKFILQTRAALEIIAQINDVVWPHQCAYVGISKACDGAYGQAGKTLVKLKPDLFPAKIQDEGWPETQWILDWAKGTPCVDKGAGQQRKDTSHRKMPTCVMARADEPRILAVAKECKRLKIER